jgi:hypothetical protein
MKNLLIKLHWFFSTQLGVDPKTLLNSFRGIPRFLRDLNAFKKGYAGKLTLLPCLHDWYSEAGSTQNEYFLQDLMVARMIHEVNPLKHVDIGSRVDGFVAHVASYREVEVFDIRPIATKIPGIIFKQADFMSSVSGYDGYCDSLSCLHAIEHFGLGRYGDPINPKGYELGIANMSRILASGGILYLATPIGIERVEFNANRIFDPIVIKFLAAKYNLKLSGLYAINRSGLVSDCLTTDASLRALSLEPYNLGIFVFTKDT